MSTPYVFIPGSISKGDAFRTGLVSLPIYHWPKEVTWLGPKSRTGDSTPLQWDRDQDEDVGQCKGGRTNNSIYQSLGLAPKLKLKPCRLVKILEFQSFVVLIRKSEGTSDLVTHLATTQTGGQQWDTLPTSSALQD